MKSTKMSLLDYYCSTTIWLFNFFLERKPVFQIRGLVGKPRFCT